MHARVRGLLGGWGGQGRSTSVSSRQVGFVCFAARTEGTRPHACPRWVSRDERRTNWVAITTTTRSGRAVLCGSHWPFRQASPRPVGCRAGAAACPVGTARGQHASITRSAPGRRSCAPCCAPGIPAGRAVCLGSLASPHHPPAPHTWTLGKRGQANHIGLTAPHAETGGRGRARGGRTAPVHRAGGAGAEAGDRGTSIRPAPRRQTLAVRASPRRARRGA